MLSPELAEIANDADAARWRNRQRILRQDPELAWSLGFGLPEPPTEAPWWRRLGRAITSRLPGWAGATRPAVRGRTGADDPAPALK